MTQTEPTMFRTCYKCSKNEEETRPYGPSGQDVCFSCATATPEAQAETFLMFSKLFLAAKDVSAIDVVELGSVDGPMPSQMPASGTLH